jgi:RimJ/RimL family protein N-acetyltransferase
VVEHTIKFLEGDRIYLRPVEAEDLDAYYTFLMDPEMNKWTGTQTVFSKHSAANWIERIATPSEERVDLMILTQTSNQLIGEVVLNDIDTVNRRANIRIAISGENSRGQGYGTEAMLLMLRHAFGTLQLHRVELAVYAFNERALHVYEKLGFKREGVQRDYLYWNFKYHDAITMSLLAPEYRTLHQKG